MTYGEFLGRFACFTISQTTWRAQCGYGSANYRALLRFLKSVQIFRPTSVNGFTCMCPLARLHVEDLEGGGSEKRDLTETEFECNCELACRVLKQLNAIVPQSWPLPDHIFHFFIADIYWSTRPSARKSAKLDTVPVPVPVYDIIPPTRAAS
jgi:hypothetical protein